MSTNFFIIHGSSPMTGDFEQIIMVGDDSKSWFLPVDPANSDYQAYIAWLAEGNTPQPWEAEENTSLPLEGE